MNRRSRPTTVLLDKSVAREALRGLQKLRAGQTLPERQFISLSAIVSARELSIPLCITRELFNIVRRPQHFPVAGLFLPQVQILVAGRYLRRWARRLREEGLSREDGTVVAYASFGVNHTTQTVGTDAVLTTDYALQARYEQRFSHIHERFERMTRQLQAPYRDATLPSVLRPEELLALLPG